MPSPDFRNAVSKTPGLERAYRPGLKALRPNDRERVDCGDTRQLVGSVNVDQALARSMPNEHRWDYGIGVRERPSADQVVWVEVHPASSQHVEGVIQKLRWLKRWLDRVASPLAGMPRRFVWVASGKVSIPAGSPQRKLVASEGVEFVARRLQL